MHLLCLTHLFYPALGGTERALLDLSREMAKKGHRVTIITSNQITLEDFRSPRPHPDLPVEDTHEGIQILRLSLSPIQRFVLAKMGALCLRGSIPSGDILWFMTQVPHLPQMIRKAREMNPDILYAVPFPTATSYYAWRAAKKLGCPWVIQPHIHEAQINASLLKIMGWLFPKASAILSNTEAEKNFMVAQGLDPAKIRVLGQGLPLTTRPSGDGRSFRTRYGLTEEPLVVFLGRKVEGKGIEFLLEAMPPVWAEVPNAVLLLAGQTSGYFQDLMSRSPTARDGRIRSLNNFPEEEKNDLLAAADLLTLPSSVESFGVVFLEAWARTRPVIGADIPAVAAMIEEGKDGLLVPYGDPQALAGAILRLLKDPDLRRKMGEAGEKKVRERFEAGQVTGEIEAFFQELIEHNSKK